MSNHLGNVLKVITNRRFQIQETATGFTHTVKYYEPDVFSSQDYDPFGMITFGRSWEAGSGYRYGYQDSEIDSYLDPNLGFYTTFYRELNCTTGRWLSTDPRTNSNASESPYISMANNPIFHTDILGDEIWVKAGLFKKVKYNEQDNKFYNKNGSEYTKTNNFVGGIYSNLIKLNSDEAGSKLLSELSQSKYKYIITNKSSSYGSGQFSARQNGKGGVIYGGFPTNSFNSTLYFEGLTHELFHAYQNSQGIQLKSNLNAELEAYMFSTIVTARVTANFGKTDVNESWRQLISGQNTGLQGSENGSQFEKDYKKMLFNTKFDSILFDKTLTNFQYSLYNVDGRYNSFKIDPEYKPVIGNFYPLITK